MIKRKHLENLSKRQKEINLMQSALNDEFGKYKKELFHRARAVLKWKDDNLGQRFLKGKRLGYIHKLRSKSLVLCLPDWDDELPTRYYNVSFNEIYSDDWKEAALKEYETKIQRKLEEEQAKKEKALAEQEIRERAEYERLKAKFEKGE